MTRFQVPITDTAGAKKVLNPSSDSAAFRNDEYGPYDCLFLRSFLLGSNVVARNVFSLILLGTPHNTKITIGVGTGGQMGQLPLQL